MKVNNSLLKKYIEVINTPLYTRNYKNGTHCEIKLIDNRLFPEVDFGINFASIDSYRDSYGNLYNDFEEFLLDTYSFFDDDYQGIILNNIDGTYITSREEKNQLFSSALSRLENWLEIFDILGHLNVKKLDDIKCKKLFELLEKESRTK